jgi:hypothetical protein
MNKRLIFLFVGLILIVLIIVLNSTLFTVSEINISSDCGTDWYDGTSLIEASGITQGKNIFSISEKKVTDNVEASDPYVRVTSVERIFPNKILIHITLRVPVIAIKISGSNQYFITDWELNVIAVAESGSVLYNDSALIKGITLTVDGEPEALIGTKLDEEALLPVSEIAAAAGAMGIYDSGFSAFIEEIDLSTAYHAYVKTNSGVTLVLVTGTDISVSDYFEAAYSLYVSLDIADSRRLSGYWYIPDGGEGWVWTASIE